MESLHPSLEIARLIAKEKIGKLSAQEDIALQQWIAQSEPNKLLYDRLKDEKTIATAIDELKKFNSQKAYKKVAETIEKEDQKLGIIKLVPNLLKYAAALILLLISTFFIARYVLQPEVTTVAQSNIVVGKQKAILITSNNQQIELDSLATKQLSADKNVQVFQEGSTLNYSINDSVKRQENKEIAYNTLITPLGGEYTVILSDGTEVTLNAGSSLKYPVVFVGNTREVILEGEAYFRVTKSKTAPFLVKTNQLTTTVYGTEFDVSAYSNDEMVRTTLVEGSVGISLNSDKTNIETKLVPGQQFNYNKTEGISETRQVNTEQYTAWTKGMFVFENEPIEKILTVLSRWYNFSFEFDNETIRKQRFTISIGRYDHVSKILDLIAISSGIEFKAKENTIVVYSK